MPGTIRSSIWRLLGRVRQLVLPLCILLAPAFSDSQVTLDSVLAQMDENAAHFRTAEANFTWTLYNSVVNEVAENETGKIYFERSGKQIKMAADITQPDARRVVFSDGKIEIYQPKMGTVDVYDASAHREEFETFLVLGFGSSGEDVRKSFYLRYGGEEKVDGVDAAKLELTPKSEKVRNSFPRIELWIDLRNGVSVQQKLIESDGYRLAKYSDIQLQQKIPEAEFKLKTSHNTKVLTH
jgi:outer membrane lipoprotein-sorting protein